MSGLARQNFTSVSEEALNNQINLELKASHIYLQLSSYFARDNVSLFGFAAFFKHQSSEEREHGMNLIDYVNKRGGRVQLQSIPPPDMDFNSPMTAMELTLQLEREVNKALLSLHKIAEQENDPSLCDFIEGTYLTEQVDSIKEIADMVTQLKRLGGDGVGLYLFDKELKEKFSH